MRVLLLLFCATCCALAAPELDIPPEIQATDEYVIVTPKGDCKSVTYVGQSGVAPFPSTLFEDKRVFMLPVRGLAAGRYRFTAVGSLDDKHCTRSFTVVVGNPPQPQPGPNPDPKPDPGPTPTPSNKPVKFVVVVEETADGAGVRGNFLLSRAVATRFREKGISHRVVDKDGRSPNGLPPADVKRFLDEAKGKTLPRLYLLDEAGYEIAPALDMPSDAAQFLELLKKYGG